MEEKTTLQQQIGIHLMMVGILVAFGTAMLGSLGDSMIIEKNGEPLTEKEIAYNEQLKPYAELWNYTPFGFIIIVLGVIVLVFPKVDEKKDE